MHGDNDFRAFKEFRNAESSLDGPHRIVTSSAEQKYLWLVKFVNQSHIAEDSRITRMVHCFPARFELKDVAGGISTIPKLAIVHTTRATVVCADHMHLAEG